MEGHQGVKTLAATEAVGKRNERYNRRGLQVWHEETKTLTNDKVKHISEG
jgi:hypothetical protein